jgi:hypothetical protein
MGDIRIAGHWEIGWNTPIKEAELWNFPLRDFGIKIWYMWPVTGIRHGESQWVKLREKHSFEEILAENQDVPHVYMEPNNPCFKDKGSDLRDFQHPEDVLYVFGSNHFNPTVGHLREEDKMITLPTIRNNGVLWPHQVLVALLYDRMAKGWA